MYVCMCIHIYIYIYTYPPQASMMQQEIGMMQHASKRMQQEKEIRSTQADECGILIFI